MPCAMLGSVYCFSFADKEQTNTDSQRNVEMRKKEKKLKREEKWNTKDGR